MPHLRVAMLHVVFLGGISLMTFSVATMVVLSHGGEAQRLKEPLPILWMVGAGVGGALICRVTAELAPGAYFTWLNLSATLWIAAVSMWIGFVWPRVLRSPPSGEAFERMHDEAKRRLQAPAC
jgi:uncharacterized protein involved in response to NO